MLELAWKRAFRLRSGGAHRVSMPVKIASLLEAGRWSLRYTIIALPLSRPSSARTEAGQSDPRRGRAAAAAVEHARCGITNPPSTAVRVRPHSPLPLPRVPRARVPISKTSTVVAPARSRPPRAIRPRARNQRIDEVRERSRLFDGVGCTLVAAEGDHRAVCDRVVEVPNARARARQPASRRRRPDAVSELAPQARRDRSMQQDRAIHARVEHRITNAACRGRKRHGEHPGIEDRVHAASS